MAFDLAGVPRERDLREAPEPGRCATRIADLDLSPERRHLAEPFTRRRASRSSMAEAARARESWPHTSSGDSCAMASSATSSTTMHEDEWAKRLRALGLTLAELRRTPYGEHWPVDAPRVAH
jgi:hypothetical protein